MPRTYEEHCIPQFSPQLTSILNEAGKKTYSGIDHAALLNDLTPLQDTVKELRPEVVHLLGFDCALDLVNKIDRHFREKIDANSLLFSTKIQDSLSKADLHKLEAALDSATTMLWQAMNTIRGKLKKCTLASEHSCEELLSHNDHVDWKNLQFDSQYVDVSNIFRGKNGTQDMYGQKRRQFMLVQEIFEGIKTYRQELLNKLVDCRREIGQLG